MNKIIGLLLLVGLIACPANEKFGTTSSGLLAGEEEIFQIKDFLDEPNDCVARPSYGGKYPVLCDIAPAVQAAVLACEARTTSTVWSGVADLPCTIEGFGGVVYWASQVSVCGNIKIDLKNAKVMTADGVSPIVFHGFGRCQTDGRPSAGQSGLKNALLRRYSVATSTTVIAIEAHAPVRLENLSILGYTQGVQIVASTNTSNPLVERANANSWMMTNVAIQSSEHTGLYINGPDVNVGTAVKVGATGNCKKGSSLDPQGLGETCADIYDGSFLGCTFVAASTGYAKDTSTNEVFPGIVLGDSANSRSVCVGCYIESGYGNGIQAGTTNVIGGIGGWTGGGNRLEGNRISGLESVGVDGKISVKLGSLTGGGALTLTPIGDSGSYPLRWKYSTSNGGVFYVDVGNAGVANVLRIGAKNTTPTLGLGGLMLRPNNSIPNIWVGTTGWRLAPEVAP